MVEKPFGTDLASAQAAEPDDERVLPGGRDLPGGSLAGSGPAGERAVRPVRQRGHRSAAEPRPRGQRPDHDGRGIRRRRPRQLLRPHRGDPRRRAEPHAAGPRQRARRRARGPRPRRLAQGKGQADRVAAAADTGGHRQGPVRGLPGRRRRRARVEHRDLRRGAARGRLAALGRRPDRDPGRQVHAGHRDRGGHPLPPVTPRHPRAGRDLRAEHAAVPHLAGERGRAHPQRQEAGSGLGPAAARTSRSRSSRDPTCARTTGSSAPP